MNFSITINGEGPELTKALQTLKTALDGQPLSSGSVTTIVNPEAPNPYLSAPPSYPQQPQPDPQQQGYPAQQQQPYGQPGGYPQQPAQPYPPQPGYPQPPQGYQPQPPAAQQPDYPQQPPVQQQATGGVPVQAQSYTQDQLARAAGSLVDGGRGAEVVGLLESMGVPRPAALTALPPHLYGAFATQLRAMGAPI